MPVEDEKTPEPAGVGPKVAEAEAAQHRCQLWVGEFHRGVCYSGQMGFNDLRWLLQL